MARGQLSDRQLEAWRAFLRAHAAVIEALGRELEAEQGLPLTYYDVLVVLSESGGQVRMNELADRVVLSRSGVTRLIDRMARDGLVRREQCPSDRRGWLAAITPAGRRALRKAWPVHARGIAEHFASRLSEDEARVLADALGRLAPPVPAPKSG